MNESQRMIVALFEYEKGTGMNMIFRDILIGLVKRGIFQEEEARRVFDAWMEYKGKMEPFVAKVLKKLVTETQYKFLLASLGAR